MGQDPWGKPPTWMLVSAAMVPVSIAAVLLYSALREPEIVHDLDGAACYRERGADAFQQSIEACVALGNRQMISCGGPALVQPDSWAFCCAPRGPKPHEAVCDKP